MADWGIKVSKAGTSVASAEPRDYILNSAYGAVKVVKEPDGKTYGSVTVGASSTGTATIAHNLGFIPLAMIFTELKPGSGRWYNGVAVAGPDDSDSQVGVNNVEDGTNVGTANLNIVYGNQSGSEKTIKYYYFIFGDSGS